jgi:hypothetical protein
MNNPPNFSHILQKKRILKNFTVVKVASNSKIEEIKKKALAKAKTEDEFNKIMEEEIKKIGNMHNQENPIPGIIYDKIDI